LELTILFLTTFFIALILRLTTTFLHRKWFLQGFFGDSSIHFGIIKQLKKRFFSKYVEQYLIAPEPMSYPTGFHRFASLFSLDILQKYPFLPNLFIFTLGSGFFTVYLHYLEVNYFNIQDYKLTIYSAVFYFTLITNWYFDGPNIAYIKLSERLLGRVGTSFYFLFSFVAIFYQDTYSFYLASFIGGLTLISSVFSRQVLIFVTILQALLLFSFQPLEILILSFVIAFIFSNGHFLRGMKHTLIQWKLYATHTKKSKVVTANLSSFFNFKSLSEKTFLRKILYLANKEPFHLLIFLLEIPLLMILTFISEKGLSTEIWIYLGSIFIIYLTTSLERFNHLGESYRYPEYSLYFLLPFLLTMTIINNNIPFLNTYTIIYFALVFIILFLYIYLIFKRDFPKNDVLQNFLQKTQFPENTVIFPVSMRLGGDICARGNYKSFWWQPGIISTAIYEEFVEEYPFLKKEWQSLFNKFNVKFVIVDKNALVMKENIGMTHWQYDFTHLDLIHEDENYIAYKVNQ
jgi:hypothetical protein